MHISSEIPKLLNSELANVDRTGDNLILKCCQHVWDLDELSDTFMKLSITLPSQMKPTGRTWCPVTGDIKTDNKLYNPMKFPESCDTLLILAEKKNLTLYFF